MGLQTTRVLPGALLATPLTVTIMIVLREFDATRWLPELLANELHLAGLLVEGFGENGVAREAEEGVLEDQGPGHVEGAAARDPA